MANKAPRKCKSGLKPTFTGKVTVDEGENPVIASFDFDRVLRLRRKSNRLKAKELERERREIEKALNKVQGSLLEELLKIRDAMRWWWEDDIKCKDSTGQ